MLVLLGFSVFADSLYIMCFIHIVIVYGVWYVIPCVKVRWDFPSGRTASFDTVATSCALHVIIILLLGTNIIDSFTTVTFSMKLGIISENSMFCESCDFLWITANLILFMKIL